jgi:hypothetical protein
MSALAPLPLTLLVVLGAGLTHHLLAHRHPRLLLAAHLGRSTSARAVGVVIGGLVLLGGVQGLAEWYAATGVTRGLLAALVAVGWVLAASWAVKLDSDPSGRRTASVAGV